MTKSEIEKPAPEAPQAAPAPKPAEDRAAPAPVVRDPGLPEPQGLYDPANEKDACGVGFIADMKNRRSHAIVEQGLQILKNLDHRGAVGADPKMGDGLRHPRADPAIASLPRNGAKAGSGCRRGRIRRRAPVHAPGPGGLPHRRGDRHQGDRG
jgi:hypothetical protein